jgi:hypothetical protein
MKQLGCVFVSVVGQGDVHFSKASQSLTTKPFEVVFSQFEQKIFQVGGGHSGFLKSGYCVCLI